MRIRDAQRLIFGSMSLLMLMLIGSVWSLAVVVGRSEPEISASPEMAREEAFYAFEIPGAESWALLEDTEFLDEIQYYTLSGTFQTFDMKKGSVDEVARVRSLALVDDVQEGRQRLVKEGDRLGSFLVQNIGLDQITLARQEQLFVLALSGEVASASMQESQERDLKTSPPVSFEDMPALETNRFGKRIAENQWVIQREAVFNYAEEIMGNPYRAVQLYRSFSQVAENRGDEAGFQVQMKGEQDFLTAMGLGDGDIIRRVNSMDMESQVRAEYLVREFMNSRMSAVVLDVENNGESRKQIFIVR